MPPKSSLPVLHAAAIQHAELRVDHHGRSHSGLRLGQSRASMLSLHTPLTTHTPEPSRSAFAEAAPATPRRPPAPLTAETIMERTEDVPPCNRRVLVFTVVCVALSVAGLAVGIGALMTSYVHAVDNAHSSAAALTFPLPSGAVDDEHVGAASVLDSVSCSALNTLGCRMPGLADMATLAVERSRALFSEPLSTILTAFEPFNISRCAQGQEALPSVQLALTSQPYPMFDIPSLLIRCPSLLYNQRFAFALTYDTVSYVVHIHSASVAAETIGPKESLTFSVPMSKSQRCLMSALCFLACTVLLNVAALILLWVMQCRLRAVAAPVERRYYPEALPAPSAFMCIVVDGDASAEACRFHRSSLLLRRTTLPHGTGRADQGQHRTHTHAATSPSCSTSSHGSSQPAVPDEEAQMESVMHPFGVAQYVANPNNSFIELTVVPVTAHDGVAPAPAAESACVGEPDATNAQEGSANGPLAPLERDELADDPLLRRRTPSSHEPLTIPNSPSNSHTAQRPRLNLPLVLPAESACHSGGAVAGEEVPAFARTSPKSQDESASAPKTAQREDSQAISAPAAAAAPEEVDSAASLNPLHRGLAVESRDAVVRKRARRLDRVRINFLAARQALMSLSTLSAVTALVLVLVAMILRTNGQSTYTTTEDHLVMDSTGLQGVVNEYRSAKASYYIASIVSVLLTIATAVLLIVTMVRSSRTS